MNIFVFDTDPEKCAQMHDDVRLRKMIVEYAQILSTVTGVGYKPTHKNHPCVKWAEKFNNRDWLYALLFNCLNEYSHRFKKTHRTELTVWDDLIQGDTIPLNIDHTNMPIDSWCFCMPDKYKSNNIVNSYRNYFLSEKLTDKNGKFIAKWTNREVPEWVANDERYLKFVGEVENA